MYELQAVADFELLLGGVFGEAPDLLPAALQFLGERFVAALELLDPRFLLRERAQSARPAPRMYGVTAQGKDSDGEGQPRKRSFHSEVGLWNIMVTLLSGLTPHFFGTAFEQI